MGVIQSTSSAPAVPPRWQVGHEVGSDEKYRLVRELHIGVWLCERKGTRAIVKRCMNFEVDAARLAASVFVGPEVLACRKYAHGGAELVTELLGENLSARLDFVRSLGGNESHTVQYVCGVVGGLLPQLRSLAAVACTHGDISPDNIVAKREGTHEHMLDDVTLVGWGKATITPALCDRAAWKPRARVGAGVFAPRVQWAPLRRHRASANRDRLGKGGVDDSLVPVPTDDLESLLYVALECSLWLLGGVHVPWDEHCRRLGQPSRYDSDRELETIKTAKQRLPARLRDGAGVLGLLPESMRLAFAAASEIAVSLQEDCVDTFDGEYDAMYAALQKVTQLPVEAGADRQGVV